MDSRTKTIIILLTISMCITGLLGCTYWLAQQKICRDSEGVVINTPEGKKICLIHERVQKEFCIDDLGLHFNAEGFE